MTGERSSWAAHRTDRAYHKGGLAMIPSGLKVGETYLEGELVYKVVKVLSDGRYEGTWAGEIPSEPSKSPKAVVKTKEEVKEEVEDIDYLSLPYAQLKKLCADRGLDAKGSKADLIARLDK